MSAGSSARVRTASGSSSLTSRRSGQSTTTPGRARTTVLHCSRPIAVIRISTRAVDHVLRRWCRKLGIPMVHAHQLRSRFATDLDAMGVPLEEISTLLGHASPQTTMAYIRKDAARVRAATSPRSNPESQSKD